MSEAIHATAVLAGAHGVLMRGPSGAGKSSLAALLIDRGARLIADDRLHLSACGDRILAVAPHATAGLLELRGRGIVGLPYERCAIVRLVVDIVGEDELERLPTPETLSLSILGVALPRQPVTGPPDRALPVVEAAIRALSAAGNMGLRSARVWG